MDILTPFRIIIGNCIGLIRYLTFEEEIHYDKMPRLLIDITEVHLHDNGTGVPRVTNGIRSNLHEFNIPYKIVEVYAKPHNQGFFEVSNSKPLKVAKGDFFFGLDFSKFQIPKNKIYIKKMQKIGIPVWFFLHDLIPITHPQYCKKADIANFKKWIDIVKKSDGFIANSKATKTEMNNWLKKQPEWTYNKNIRSGFIHLASTFKNNKEFFLKGNFNSEVLQFLAVSTVEPRKRYDQILNAFDLLWKEDFDISLHIVGKPGWNNESVFNQIYENSELNRRLFWHKDFISDEELAELYKESSALIFASETEGFGIPLIEAAEYGKPLIVRDIPIFREVTENQALFFNGYEAKNLANAIKDFLKLYEQNKIPVPKIKIYTWKESTKETLDILFGTKQLQEA